MRAGAKAITAVVAALACGSAAGTARGQSVQEFYAGKQVKFVVGSAGGGGYEFYSRLVGRYMSRHLPGNPIFVVTAMPGAAGIIAANHLFNVAPKDGTEIGMVGRAAGTQPLLDPKDTGPRYTATKFNWIGSPQQEVGLVLARTSSAVAKLDDLRTRELVVSGTSPASPPSYYPRLFNNLLATRFKVVDGYKSSQDALLAMERGEVDGHSSGSSAAPVRSKVGPLVADGTIRIIAQIGMARDPEYPNVPLILDLARGNDEKQILELVLTQQAMAWPIVAPPGVPVDRIKALREAFDKAIVDKDLLADAAKEKLVINPISGAEIAALLERVYATPKDVLERTAALSAQN